MERDVNASVLRCLAQIAEQRAEGLRARDVAALALPLISPLFGDSMVSWNSIDRSGEPGMLLDRPAAESVDLTRLHEMSAIHPLSPCISDPMMNITRVSDVISPRQWEGHPIYRDLLAAWSVPLFSVLVPLHKSDDKRDYLMLNRDVDFTDREVGGLNILQGGMAALLWAPPRPTVSPLTVREVEVLRVLDIGLEVAGVARRLGISYRTADKHIENIHRKLDTHDLLATLRVARRTGLLE